MHPLEQQAVPDEPRTPRGQGTRPARRSGSARVHFSPAEEGPWSDARRERRSRSHFSLASTSESELWGISRTLHAAQSLHRTSEAGRTPSFNARGYRKTSSKLGRVGGTLAHYAALVIAEDPIQEHKEYKAAQREQEELQGSAAEEGSLPPGSQVGSVTSVSERTLSDHLEAIEEGNTAEQPICSDAEGWALQNAEKQARRKYRAKLQEQHNAAEQEQLIAAQRTDTTKQRWQMACSSIISSARLVRNADILTSTSSRPKDRLAALVELWVRLVDHPQAEALMKAMVQKPVNRFDSFVDTLLNELLITGESVFDWLTPAKMGSHQLLFTPAIIFIMFAVFFFTTGEYQFYAAQTYGSLDPAVQNCLATSNAGRTAYGVRQMLSWMWRNSTRWCFQTSPWVLDADFLIQWGARWGPYMRSDGYRWFSAWFLHLTFQHVLSNMLLYAAVAYQVEEKYGCTHVGLLFLISAMGGSLFSAAFEDPCIAVVGASGGVFGVVGLFIADMIMNFKHIRRPILRGVMMTAFLIYFIVTVVTGPAGTSHLSHVGGFLCGLFPAFLFLPNLGHEKWEAVLPWVSIPILICIFAGLPTYFYRYRMPTECPK